LIACRQVFEEYREGRFGGVEQTADATARSFGG